MCISCRAIWAGRPVSSNRNRICSCFNSSISWRIWARRTATLSLPAAAARVVRRHGLLDRRMRQITACLCSQYRSYRALDHNSAEIARVIASYFATRIRAGVPTGIARPPPLRFRSGARCPARGRIQNRSPAGRVERPLGTARTAARRAARQFARLSLTAEAVGVLSFGAVGLLATELSDTTARRRLSRVEDGGAAGQFNVRQAMSRQ